MDDNQQPIVERLRERVKGHSDTSMPCVNAGDVREAADIIEELVEALTEARSALWHSIMSFPEVERKIDALFAKLETDVDLPQRGKHQ